jgi:hypothetical protein
MKNYYILFLLSLLGLDSLAQQGYNELATPKRLGAFINTSAEESLPLLSADGKDLYFFRTFEEYNFGGVNDQDIWLCSKNEKGNWWNLIPNSGCETWIDVAGSMRTFSNLSAAVAYAEINLDLAELFKNRETREN